MCDHPVEKEQELDDETKQALKQLAKGFAEAFVECAREDGIRRILQKKCQKQTTETDHV